MTMPDRFGVDIPIDRTQAYALIKCLTERFGPPQITATTEALRLQPIATAPRDGTYILLAGLSGYMGTPLRMEVCKYDQSLPRSPWRWRNHAGDAFMDGGDAPTHWMPLPLQMEAPR